MPGIYLNEWGESHNFILNGHPDINTACMESPVKSAEKKKMLKK